MGGCLDDEAGKPGFVRAEAAERLRRPAIEWLEVESPFTPPHPRLVLASPACAVTQACVIDPKHGVVLFDDVMGRG
jgi:hypothetical protein